MNTSKWCNLSKSLSQEEVRYTNQAYADSDVIGGPPPPPDDFEIEDAYAHSKLDTDRGSNYVASSSNHVTGYMEKLQQVLQ